MKLQIKHIKNRGEANERVVLIAKQDCEIGVFFIFTSARAEDGGVSSGVSHPYWIPDNKISTGDMVVIYTKDGTTGEKINSDGTKSYFYYRGISTPVFTDKDKICLLLESSQWDFA